MKSIGRNGGQTGVQGDVTKLGRLDRLYARVKKDKGHVDIVFANAGAGGSAANSAWDRSPRSKTRRDSSLNVKGLDLHRPKGAAASQCGRADRSSSMHRSQASMGMEAFSVYGATKAAVHSFARTWTVDLKHRKIRVNAISPAPIDTPILEGVPKDALDAFVALIPRGTMGRPEEIATAALFLASSDSSFVTGIELFVSGGVSQI